VFLALYSWRPAFFGFYSDDWSIFLHPAPGSLTSFADYMGLYANRPVSGILSWLAESLIGWNPATAQIINMILTAAAAASIGWLVARLITAVRWPCRCRLSGLSVDARLLRLDNDCGFNRTGHGAVLLGNWLADRPTFRRITGRTARILLADGNLLSLLRILLWAVPRNPCASHNAARPPGSRDDQKVGS
jgi:hypothetical protein